MRYHLIKGERIPFTPEENAEWDLRDAVADEKQISDHREARRETFRYDADRRIAAYFSNKEGVELLKAENNMQAYYSDLSNKKADLILRKIDGEDVTPELAAVNEQIAPLKMIKDVITDTIAAENVASAELDAAGLDENMTPAERIAEIDAVVAVWP